MKWQIARIIAVIFLALGIVILCPEKAEPVMASNTADVLVKVTPEWGMVSPPADFTVTRITDTEVLIEWTPPEGTANTSIRMKVNSLPEDKDDGYLVYCGNASTFTDTWLDLDVIWSEVYYVAYSQNATGGWSDEYVWDYTESPYVEGISGNLSALGDTFRDMEVTFGGINDYIPQIIGLVICLLLTVIAFWHRERLLYVLAGLSWIAYGAMEFSSNLYIALILFMLGVYNFVKAALDHGKAAKG